MAYNTIAQVDFGQATAAADFTGELYKAGIETGESVAIAGVAGGRIDCVIHTDAPLGFAVRTVKKGTTKASAGAAVSAGDSIAVDANGQFVTAVATDIVVGKAVTAAGAQNEIFTMYFYGADSYAAA